MSTTQHSSSALVYRANLPSGTHRFTVGARNVQRMTLYWSSFDPSPGASSTIAIYAGSEARVGDLDDTDPATNMSWALLPDTFATTPGATTGSDSLPLVDLAADQVLVELVIAGAALLDFSLTVTTVTD